MALTNCEYNKVKVQHKLCCLSWFIQKHALEDADKEGASELKELLISLMQDLEKYSEKIEKLK